MAKSAAFFDRDGTINIDKGYVYLIEDFEWITYSKEAIKFLNDHNYYVFIVTNQSGIGRGYYSERDVKKLHKYMNHDLKKISAHIDDFFYSPFHPDAITNKYDKLSNLRKPKTGMLELAYSKWRFDKKSSFMIGDNIKDVECGENFGIDSYLFESNKISLLELIKKII